MGDYLDTLSGFVSDTRYEQLSAEAVTATKDVVLDTVGAIVAGSRLPENAAFARLIAQRSGPGTATLLGHPLKADPMTATLVNGTVGVSLEMDEGNRYGGGHPSIHVTPGALAVGEEMGISGKLFIESVLVGYEVSSRIGGATVARDNVHSHGHWGTFGTAAAVAKLKGYGPGQVRTAINLAASMSPANTWTPCFEGATIRNLYSGRSGFQGVLAVHLYECGFTALNDAPADVFGTILGDEFDPALAVEGMGNGAYRIQQNYFKFHACCRYNHPALDAVSALRRRESFQADEVQAVDVTTIGGIPQGMVREEYPDNMLGAKFSIPYAVAAAIVRGGTDISAFYPESVDNDVTRDLAGRVNVVLDTNMTMRWDDQPCARVVVKLKDGRHLSEDTYAIRGDAANPVTRQELLDKFMFLTSDILGEQKAQDVIEATDHLEELSDVREMTSLLA